MSRDLPDIEYEAEDGLVPIVPAVQRIDPANSDD